jgi:hypothetical protein
MALVLNTRNLLGVFGCILDGNMFEENTGQYTTALDLRTRN